MNRISLLAHNNTKLFAKTYKNCKYWKKYCKYYHLNRIKTTDYGTLLELDFRVVMKNKAEEKQFIDELRERNGNLNISLIQNMAEEL